jgi:hypothetical protein
LKTYLDTSGRYHRTQAEAKASGLEFELVEVPTDHAGLVAFLNRQRPVEETPAPAPVTPDGPYQNGDPTRVYRGSRDPAAPFLCVHCGRQNNPQET